MTKENHLDILGKSSYILVDVFGEGCIYCYNMVSTINDIATYLNTTKKDIKIYKLDANRQNEISRRYEIRYYPTLLLFRPGDVEFPFKMEGRHDFNQIKRLVDSFILKQKSKEELLSEEEIDKLCKTEVQQAISVYERELREGKLLITREEREYFDNLQKKMQELGKKDKDVENELKNMEDLEIKARKSEEKGSQEFNVYREEVIIATKERFAKILDRLEGKISDMQATLDNRGIVRRKGKKEEKKENKKEDNPDVARNEKDCGDNGSSFAFSFLIKHFISFCCGVVFVVVFQRLKNLDEVVKFHGRL